MFEGWPGSEAKERLEVLLDIVVARIEAESLRGARDGSVLRDLHVERAALAKALFMVESSGNPRDGRAAWIVAEQACFGVGTETPHELPIKPEFSLVLHRKPTAQPASNWGFSQRVEIIRELAPAPEIMQHTRFLDFLKTLKKR